MSDLPALGAQPLPAQTAHVYPGSLSFEVRGEVGAEAGLQVPNTPSKSCAR